MSYGLIAKIDMHASHWRNRVNGSLAAMRLEKCFFNYNFSETQIDSRSEAVEVASLALERVDYIHGCDGLASRVLV